MDEKFETTFHAVRVQALPGQTILRLSTDWKYDDGVLKAGTEVQPVSVGQNNVRGRRERVVSVVGDPPATGRTCVGPF